MKPLSFYFYKNLCDREVNSRARIKTKNMEQDIVQEEKTCHCPECEKRELEAQESETMNFAILLALMPAVTISFLNTAGFF